MYSKSEDVEIKDGIRDDKDESAKGVICVNSGEHRHCHKANEAKISERLHEMQDPPSTEASQRQRRHRKSDGFFPVARRHTHHPNPSVGVVSAAAWAIEVQKMDYTATEASLES